MKRKVTKAIDKLQKNLQRGISETETNKQTNKPGQDRNGNKENTMMAVVSIEVPDFIEEKMSD